MHVSLNKVGVLSIKIDENETEKKRAAQCTNHPAFTQDLEKGHTPRGVMQEAYPDACIRG